jgi:plastocyanin
MTRARRYVAVTAFAAAALLAACGSSGNDGSSGSTVAASSGGSSGGGIYGSPSDTAAASTPAAGGDAVTIKGFAFGPDDLTVKAGTKVTWTNDDSTKHKIKSDDGSFDSDDLSQGDTFEHTFDTAGSFPYICSIHPSMKGTITVTA